MHSGLQLITGTESRQQAYVSLSRGTASNIALVFTTTPAKADPELGTLAAPELARARQVERDRRGQEPPPGRIRSARSVDGARGRTRTRRREAIGSPMILSLGDHASDLVGATGFEPVTPRL